MTTAKRLPFPTYTRVLAHHFDAHPERVAFRWLRGGEVGGELATTWGELAGRASAVAARLREVAGPGDRVLLLLPPGPDYLVAFFACVWGGFLPVPAYPPQSPRNIPRLLSLVRNCGARAAVTTAEGEALARAFFAGGEAPADLHWLAVDAATAPLAAPADARPEDPLFLQYTSGSTSDPRGVRVTHANILSNLEALFPVLGLEPSMALASWMPPYHDMGLIGNVLCPLSIGAETVLMSPFDFIAKPVRWLEAISHYRVHASSGPNFAFDLCARKSTDADVARLDLASWACALNGAEPIRQETLDRFARRFAPAKFSPRAYVMAYGLAEATLIVTGGARGEGVVVDAGASPARVSSGRPTLGVDLRVVVGGERPAAEGEEGEIWVAGPGVADGYWDADDGAFRATLPGARGPFLRTGDLGYLRGGELFVTGRIKDLIIFRGKNHYPQDLEETVRACHPGLRSNAAFEVVDERGDETVVVIQEADAGLDPSALPAIAREARRRIAEEHGVGAVTIAFIAKGAIPKTSSGKLQRQATKRAWLAGELPTVRVSPSSDDGAPRSAPATPTEEKLAAAWQKALGLAAVAREDDFFALGGDSMQAVEAAAAAAELGLRFRPDLAYRAPTLAALAAAIDAAGGAGGEGRADPTRAPIPARPRGPGREEAEEPVTPMQRSTPTCHDEDHTKAWDNLMFPVPLDAVDVPALRAALDDVVAHHDALRANFFRRADGYYQRVAPRGSVPLATLDARDFPEAERHAAVGAALAREIAHRFDLQHGLLLRALLLEGSGPPLLLVTGNFLVIDHHSTIHFRDDLARAYAARRRGKAAELARAPVSYLDYGAWLHDLLRGGALEPSRRYWRDELAGLDHDPLATDREVDERGSARVSVCRSSLPRPFVDRLEAAARAAGTSPANLMLAALFDVVHARSEHDDLAIDVSLSGRDRPELRRMVGRVARHLVVRVDAGRARSDRQLVGAVHAKMFQALAHQRWPPERAAEDLGVPRRPQRYFFTNVFFVKVDVGGPAPAKGPAPFAVHYEEMQTDTLIQLGLFVVGYDDGVELVFRNRTALWGREYMTALLADYLAALSRLADGLDSPRAGKGARA